MRAVPLHGAKAAGRVALVDDDDYELVSRYRWNVSERIVPGGRVAGPYAVTGSMGGRQLVSMHKLLTGYAMTDHIDGDGLNNQRANLRPVTTSQNMQNSRAKVGTSSAYKGVTWDKRARRWRALITVGGRQKHLGCFPTEDAAALAYNAAAAQQFGEYARLNEIRRAAQLRAARRHI